MSPRWPSCPTFTADFLKPFLVVEAERLDCPLRPWFGPFGQLEQLVLDDRFDLWQQAPDVLWIAVRLEDVDRHLIHESTAIGPEATRQRLDAIGSRVVGLARTRPIEASHVDTRFQLARQTPCTA